MARPNDAMTAAAAAKTTWASPSMPTREPVSSPAACAIATAARASSHARPSERGWPSAARSAAGTPIATSASGTSAGGTSGRALGPGHRPQLGGESEDRERAGVARALHGELADGHTHEAGEREQRDEEEVREE